jgi:hypothetical protein
LKKGHNLSKYLIQLPLPGHDGEQVCNVSKPYVNIWGITKTWTLIQSKKGHTFVKMLHTIISSCLQVGVMMEYKCVKFQSHMSMDFEDIWGITKLSQNSKSKKGHNSVKMLDTIPFSCLRVWVMMMNKYAKFQSHKSMDFENIWGITKTLT